MPGPLSSAITSIVARFRRRHENKAGGGVFQQICSGFRNDDGGLLGSRFVKAHFSRKLAGIAAGF